MFTIVLILFSHRFIQRVLSAIRTEGEATCDADSLEFYYTYLQIYLCAISNDTACSYPQPTTATPAPTGQYSRGYRYIGYKAQNRLKSYKTSYV